MLLIVLKKDSFKLINNNAHGKKMEKFRRRTNVRLINNAKDYMSI